MAFIKPSTINKAAKQLSSKLSNIKNISSKTKKEQKSNSTKSSVKVKESYLQKFDKNVLENQAKNSQIYSTKYEEKVSKIKLTDEGLVSVASDKIASSNIQSKTPEQISLDIETQEAASVESEAEISEVTSSDNDDSVTSSAFMDTEATRKDIFLGPKDMEIPESKRPKVLAILQEDVDKNGIPDSLNIIIRKLVTDDEDDTNTSNFRVIGYDIYRKSVFEESNFRKIATIDSVNQSFPVEYIDSLKDIGLNDRDVFMFKDSNIKRDTVYAYKVFTRYDNNSEVKQINEDTEQALKLKLKNYIQKNINKDQYSISATRATSDDNLIKQKVSSINGKPTIEYSKDNFLKK